MRRSLADPAVRDDFLVRRHAFRFVQRFELLRRLERPVLVDRLSPGNVLRPRDVPAALRVLRRIFRRREDLPAELLRAADVDEDFARLPVRLPNVREVDAELLVRILRFEGGGGMGRHVLRHGQVLLDPLLPPAVQQDDVVHAVILEDPERERREPVVEVAVQDDPVVVRDPEAAEERLETCLRHDVAGHGIVDVLLPVDQRGSGDVAQVVVRRRVVVHLDDPDLRVSEVALRPARVDQNFGMRVTCHGPSPCPSKYYGVIFLVHIDIPIHCRKAGSWLRSPVFLPRLLRTATFAGYFQIAGTRIPVRREHGGHGPCTSGGRACAALGDSSSQSGWPRCCSADPGPSRGWWMISRTTSGSHSRTFTSVVSRRPGTRPFSLDPAVDRSMSSSRGGKSEISGPRTGTRCSRRAALRSRKCTCPSSLTVFRTSFPPRGTRTRPASVSISWTQATEVSGTSATSWPTTRVGMRVDAGPRAQTSCSVPRF